MFTGLVTAIGEVRAVQQDGPELDLAVDLARMAAPAAVGDSIALSGCCCTVTRCEGAVAWFRLSAETLRRTWFGRLRAGTRLNLEGALRAGQPLAGHIVQGHVDGTAEVLSAVGGAGGEWWVSVPNELARYCVVKGSIALDGVSLTIAALEPARMMLAIIPLTAQATTIGSLVVGEKVNVEVDILAKHVERLLNAR